MICYEFTQKSLNVLGEWEVGRVHTYNVSVHTKVYVSNVILQTN